MRTLRLAIGVFALLATGFVGIVRAADWPQFRGPGGNASSNDSVPLKWNDTQNIAWKTELPGRGASSPIVSGNRVFLTAYTGYGISEEDPGEKSNLRLHVIAIDRSTGKVVWNQSIVASEATQKMSRRVADHGYATSTPATDGKTVFAYFGVSGVVAFDFNGKQLWRTQLGTKTAGFGSASSPIVFEDLVIVNASIESKALYALDKRTGKHVWKVEPIVRAWTSPSIGKTADGKPELVLSQKGTILGIDPRTGKQLWSCVGIQDYVVPVPIVDNGIAYCLGGRKNQCIAVKLGGRGEVTESHRLWDVNVGANVTSPVFFKGHIYWVSDKGIANCLNAKTGESVYRKRLQTRSRIYGSVVRAGQRLYVPTRDKGVLVLSAKPEFEQLARNVFESDGDPLNASPALFEDQIFLRTDSFLYCIGEGAE